MGSNKGSNLAGEKYGRLLVKENTGRIHPKRGKIYICLCDCGNEKEAATSHLKYGNVKSCGCLLKESGVRVGSSRRSTNRIPRKLKKLRALPLELDGVESKIIQDGLFQVFENGRIFRINHLGKTECSIYEAKGKARYKTVSTMVDGKQKHFYVHRLIAEAFIPNPEDKPQVNHIDGDKLNNSIENLEWATAKENVLHAYKTDLLNSLDRSKPCEKCGSLTMNRKAICSECRAEITQEIREKNNRSAKAESVSHIDKNLATERQLEAIQLRESGKTFEEISILLGISKQGAQSLIKQAEKKTVNKNKIPKTIINEYNRLEKRVIRKLAKKEAILIDVAQIDAEITEINQILKLYKEQYGENTFDPEVQS